MAADTEDMGATEAMEAMDQAIMAAGEFCVHAQLQSVYHRHTHVAAVASLACTVVMVEATMDGTFMEEEEDHTMETLTMEAVPIVTCTIGEVEEVVVMARGGGERALALLTMKVESLVDAIAIREAPLTLRILRIAHPMLKQFKAGLSRHGPLRTPMLSM